MSCDWLGPSNKNHLDECTFSVDTLKKEFEVIEMEPENSWLVLFWDNEKLWLKFAVLDFCSSDGDSSNVQATILFYGDGPSGNLRECRHTYWGENGYVFYPNRKTINLALEHLSKHFDLD